eukprot:CAMPEP_0167800838 /NCGR_PEP_ID=MMETSP0111_2-20121227/18022_1 /TAXON_ID=91324 /ORGANISM="Lotharella globosa, Strain CCCM811" /LENGTH=40 /DNA_ID= /DNA_START= /DNA_END= /DNA_ORIENTATION=
MIPEDPVPTNAERDAPEIDLLIPAVPRAPGSFPLQSKLKV